jgi:transcriptional regulator with XRE-family HTH domain
MVSEVPSPEPLEPQRGLARAVKALREREKLDQAGLAERADLPVAAIAEIESGEGDPVWGDVRLVAQGLGVTLEELAELAEEIEGASPP